MNVDSQNCIIFILICLFSVLCYSLLFKKPKLGCDLPPSPPSLPIIGHLHHFLSLLIHKSLQKLSTNYGPLLYLRVFSVPIVLASSSSIAYEIFKAQDENVSTRNFLTIEGSLLLGSLGFTTAPYGKYWKLMKKIIVTNLLGPQALERSQSVRANELERFYSNLLDKAIKKERVVIVEEAMKLVNNTITKMIIGRSCSEENGEAERVRSLVAKSDTLSKKMFFSAIFKKLGISLFKRELIALSHNFDEVLEKILVEHEEKVEEHHQSTEVMDVLLEAYGDKNAKEEITKNHIKSLFVDLFVAGTDTSTHTIQWIMAEIINNSYLLERLREEIDSVIGIETRLIQETDIPNLPYLQATVKEGLRLHPPVPFFFRTFQEGCKIRDFHIPEKTILLVNAYAIMRDPHCWEDPLQFKPERFLVSSGSSQKNEIRDEFLKYIPFGSGRRGCPGENLAYVSVGTAIGVMVQCFDWIMEGDKVNMNEAAGTITLVMAHPLKCTPVPRTIIPFTSNMQIPSS